MARKTGKELEKLKKKFNVQEIYSWSRYNCFKTDLYTYFLKYIKKIPEDRKDGIYAVSGGVAHDILERFYLKELEYADMITEYENALFNFNLSELKYNRSDEEKNEKIANKYEECLKHFFKHHEPITKKVEIERFVPILVGKFLFQAYIDFMHKENGNLYVTDWKTSTIYTGKKIDKERGQLVLYAEGIRQMGVPLEKIIIRWGFLKYVTVEMPQANGNIAVRNIERHDIGNKLSSNIKMWMKKTKQYTEEEIDGYLDMVCETNDLSCLPEDIRNKYIIKDCYVEIPLSEEVIDELKEEIINTIAEISKKEVEYSKTQDEKVWWEEVTDEKSYFFSNLSGYSANLHKPYKEYLDKKELFVTKTEVEEEDMSWLNEL